MRSPSWLPVSMGPAASTMAGRFALAAPISRAGRVLSQPPMSTTASSGWARNMASTSSAIRLRRNMLVGLRKISPREMTGNSSGSPPACHTPRLTASASSRRPR